MTETIAVLFTDLVGSTELLSRVGESEAERLRREHFGLLREAVAPHGGREVKNLGDGLMVVFPSAADAVGAAVEIQRASELRNRSATEALAVRVGVALGDADAEGGDYFGVPVVEAARLCAAADGGAILATDVVRMLAGSRGGFAFESCGELELKGLDRPVAASRIGWTPVERVQERPPLPPRLALSLPQTFVGRAAEYEELTAAWKAVAGSSERRLMLLSGEPGIGKTSLSSRFAGQVFEEGAVVLYGRCDEALGIPYQPWIEALGQLVAHAPQAVLEAHVADRGPSLSRLVPELGRRVGASLADGPDGDAERFVLFECLVDLLVRVSAEAPVLVVLDDLHWADRPTIQLLRHIVMSDQPLALGILGTFRDSDVAADHPLTELLAALHRESGTVRLPLRGLGDADVLALLETIAGHEMDEQGVVLRDALLTETAGNPFFVVETLRHLVATGAIYQQDDGRWVAAADLRAVGLPVSVREVVGQRLAGLGAESQRVLALGAVIGRDFDLALLATVAQIDEDALIDLCDAAVDAAVLQATDDPERYTFAHALIEHTLYDGLSPARRARAHRAIADALEAIAGDGESERIGELAFHFAQAVQPVDAAKATRFARLAGDRALDQLAPDEALRWYTQAHELLDRAGPTGPRERALLLVGLGDAQRQCGVAAYRETLLEAARLADEIDDVPLLVRSVLVNNRGLQSVVGGIDEERIALIERALDRIDDDASPDRARLLALLCVEKIYDGDLDERVALVEEALATGRRSGDPAALANAMQWSIEGTRTLSTLDWRLAWSAEAPALADAAGGPILRYWVYNAMMLQWLEAGDVTAFRSGLALAEDLATRVPHATIRWNIAFLTVPDLCLRGDLEQTDRAIERARELGEESGQPDTLSMYAAQTVNLHCHQGRYGQLLDLLEAVVADQPLLPVYRAVLACAHARDGEVVRAQALLDDGAEQHFALPLDQGWSSGIACWAETAVLLGDRTSAGRVRELLRPCRDALATTSITILPSVSYFLARLDHLLGDLDAADERFATAMGFSEGMESPLLIAYVEAAWAALLADRGRGDDLDRARTMATDALAAATTGGYGYIERDAAAVLHRLA